MRPLYVFAEGVWEICSETMATSAHPAKKQKLSVRVEYPAPTVASLFSAAAGLAAQPSPGAMHGCRIAALVRARARGCAPAAARPVRLGARHGRPRSPTPTPPAPAPAQDLAAERGEFASVFASGPDVFLHSVRLPAPPAPRVGREGLLMPALVPAPRAVRLQLQHAGEVQAVAVSALPCDGSGSGGGGGGDVGGVVVATADSYGSGTLSRLSLRAGRWEEEGEQRHEGEGGGGAAPVAAAVESTERITPQDPLRRAQWHAFGPVAQRGGRSSNGCRPDCWWWCCCTHASP